MECVSQCRPSYPVEPTFSFLEVFRPEVLCFHFWLRMFATVASSGSKYRN